MILLYTHCHIHGESLVQVKSAFLLFHYFREGLLSGQLSS